MSWKRWRMPGITDLEMDKKLRAEGIEVLDANEFVREMDKHLYPTDWKTLLVFNINAICLIFNLYFYYTDKIWSQFFHHHPHKIVLILIGMIHK
jgi:hypothetical protein